MKTPQTDSMMQAAGNMKPEAVVVPVKFSREMETDSRSYKTELAKALERETTLRKALSLARQYLAGEFGFENWRVAKVNALIQDADKIIP